MLFICSSDLSLYFQALTVRHEQIPEAHRNTIEWRDDNAADFHEWLASGDRNLLDIRLGRLGQVHLAERIAG